MPLPKLVNILLKYFTNNKRAIAEMECNKSESAHYICSNEVDWSYIPDYVLLHIFGYLPAKTLLNVGLVCKSWYRISRDEFLWKDLFYNNYKVDRKIGIMPGATSWYSEYRRLSYHIPLVRTEWLKDHSHQVLHVSFSNDGKLFATCSKDGYILVWNSAYPATIRYQHDMKVFSWKYTQFSQFNSSDTLLLVSGVHFGTPPSTSGEIAVFSLQEGFPLQCRVINKPYDIFGVWFSEQHLLSGDLHWLGHLVSTSVLWLNKANQESVSEHVPIMYQMYKFYNMNASSIRSIMIANCRSSELENKCENEPKGTELNKNCRGMNQKGNPLSYKGDMHHPSTSRNEDSSDDSFSSDIWPYSNMGKTSDYNSPIEYSEDYRMKEFEEHCDNSTSDSESTASSSSSSTSSFTQDTDCTDDNNIIRKQNLDSKISAETEHKIPIRTENQELHLSEEELNSEGDVLLEKDHEKYLIFTTGSKTYTPHQIGFKRVRRTVFPRRSAPGPSLKERIARQRERERERDRAGAGAGPGAPDPDWLDYEAVQDKFDKVDHLIDLHGHIIGMGLSPDHRYLYVNSRPWPEGYCISNPLEPPPIAQEIDIHVIDLTTLKRVGTMLRAHKAYTPNTECFFIFLDVSRQYVASGAEDRHGYLWDRHYGACLAKYPHRDVVNSVAFNPRDPGMLVTTSDDYTVKIWRSVHKARKLGLDESSPRGLRLAPV